MAKRQEKDRKVVFGLVALVAAVGVIVGVGYAFFSDVISGEGSATAGTLDISGTVGLEQNGTAVTGNTIPNLNPGDTITFDVDDVTNNGTKSAWIRQVLEFTTLSDTDNLGGSCSDGTSTTQAACETAAGTWTPAAATAETGNLADWIWVCTGGTAAQSDLLTTFAATARGADGIPTSTSIAVGATGTTCVPATTGTAFGAKTTYTAADDVIDGTAEDDDGTAGFQTTWTPAGAPMIFFDQLAPNAAQNGEMEFAVLIQALQYRNNTTSPTESQWSTVVTSPFGL